MLCVNGRSEPIVGGAPLDNVSRAGNVPFGGDAPCDELVHCHTRSSRRSPERCQRTREMQSHRSKRSQSQKSKRSRSQIGSRYERAR